jgi:hypothetical protein
LMIYSRGTPILDRSGSTVHHAHGNGSGNSGSSGHSNNSGTANHNHYSSSGDNPTRPTTSQLDHRVQTHRPTPVGRQARRTTTDTSPELQMYVKTIIIHERKSVVIY